MVLKRRKAAADLEIVPLIPGEDKPVPPEDMCEAEQEVWRSIVNAMPLRWFGRETWPVLRALCRHTVAANYAWKAYLAALETGQKAEIIDVLALRHFRETTAVNRTSEKLRLTKSARSQPVVAERAKQHQVLRRPWDD